MAKTTNPMNQLDTMLDEYLVKKAPALPKNFKDFLVNIAPWASVIMIVFAIPALLMLFQLKRFTDPLFNYVGYRYGAMHYVSLVFLAITVVLRGLSIPGLFNRQAKGWTFVYYATLVNIVYSIFSYNILGGLIGAVISLYLLYQIKSYYK